MGVHGQQPRITVAVLVLDPVASFEKFQWVIPVGVTAEVVLQYTRACNRVERGVDHSPRNFPAQNVVLPAVDLCPLQGAWPPAGIKVACERIKSFVVVVVCIERAILGVLHPLTVVRVEPRSKAGSSHAQARLKPCSSPDSAIGLQSGYFSDWVAGGSICDLCATQCLFKANLSCWISSRESSRSCQLA